MKHICVVLLMTINVAFSYYFYNPTSHDLIVRTSLNDVPVGYKLIPPPKSLLRSRSRLSKGRLNGYCTDGGFICSARYDRSLTFQFECTNDEQCPSNYKCCSQKCFVHKICVKARLSRTNNGNNSNFRRSGQCEKWPYNCPVPYHYSLTSLFECNKDSQCPRNFKCCEQNCFTHRICSRIITDNRPEPKKIEASTAEPTTIKDDEIVTIDLLENGVENGNSEVDETNNNEEEEIQVTTNAQIETEEENDVDNDGDTEPVETTNNEDNDEGEGITNEEEDSNIVDEETTATEEAEPNAEVDIRPEEEEATTEEAVNAEEEVDNQEEEEDNREEEEANTEQEEIEGEGEDITESVDNVEEEDENNNTADDLNNSTNDNNSNTDTEQITDTTVVQENENATLDPNAISPDYSDFYYDNSTETDENAYEDEDDAENNEYDDEYEAKQ